MNYAEIKPNSIENGTGVRVSLFVSGCRHHCRECFNQETWDFKYGTPYNTETEQHIMELLAPPYIAGLTLLGGDPLEPENQKALLPLLLRMKRELPDKNLWAYTGYLYEDLLPGGRACCEVTGAFLACTDILVDGPFVPAKKSASLKFRGSANQRIIDVQQSLKHGTAVTAME